ncbi:MAG TPA: DUF1150 domain-containing protein [Alphaproteobacteria bacterium]|nr:DUF1150 domain-containing protein [Alphaproteobacteria bacterium]HAJ46751.1 DUF1150 domain-containing protein [Alphaproteobacteria bacterium]
MDRNTKSASRTRAASEFTAEALAQLGADKTVYVRSVLASKLKAEGLLPDSANIDAETTLYAVHAADGTPLAIVDNRDLAFTGARRQDMEPVSVH